MVDHDFQGGSGAGILAQLLEHGGGMRRVVNHAKGINQVIRLEGNEAAELLGVAAAKADAVFQAENGGAAAGQLHGFFGKIDGGDLGARAGKVDGVRADAAADFQDFLALPALELGKCRNVVLDEVLPGLDLVKIFLRADGRGGMPDVTGASIPVVADARDFDMGE